MEIKLFLVSCLCILQFEGYIWEGDMVVPENSYMMGLTDKSKRWETNQWGTTIQYMVDDDIKPDRKVNITKALQEIERVANCLKFEEIQYPKHHEMEYIYFFGGNWGSGCHSPIGKKGKSQTRINLDLHNAGCFVIVTIKHEVMHALGFDLIGIVSSKFSTLPLIKNCQEIPESMISNGISDFTLPMIITPSCTTDQKLMVQLSWNLITNFTRM